MVEEVVAVREEVYTYEHIRAHTRTAHARTHARTHTHTHTHTHNDYSCDQCNITPRLKVDSHYIRT